MGAELSWVWTRACWFWTMSCWIFPSGCYNDCTTELNYLIGPSLSLADWSWNLDGNPDASGSNSYATPYTLINDGLYTITVGTGNCKLESAPLDYSTTACDKCTIERVIVKEIITNDTPYCSYTFTLVVASNSTVAYQATLFDDLNNVLVLPSTFTLQPGINTLQFTVIPQSPFTGGITHWTIQGSVPNKEGFVACVYDFVVTIPSCESISNKTVPTRAGEVSNVVLQSTLDLYPNPAKDLVTLRYHFTAESATVSIYDIAGRTISTNVLSSSVGELQLTTSSFPAGVYIVVVRQDGVLLAQKKLVIE